MKKIYTYIITLTIIIFISCEKDIILKIDNVEIKQVINCYINENTRIQIYISKSKAIDDNSSIEFISNATVQLYEDGVFIENMQYILENPSNNLGFYLSNYEAKANHTYKIISTVENMKTIEATEFLPPKVTISNYRLIQYPDTIDRNRKGILKFNIEDDGNIDNFYVIDLYESIKTSSIDSLGDSISQINNSGSYFKIIDFSENESYDRRFIDDKKFNGTSKEFTIEFNGNVFNGSNILEQKIVLRISNVGKGYFDYFYSLQKNRGGVSNNNKEPISAISNINGGYGHFSSDNFKTYSIKIQ
ncbi:MAG: DUF4249 domain-containing protein [Sphingobacteriales bacterium]|nr:MAG: DUF4249 domain-containing protein [Sphingobacteriales bacterium]